MGIDGVKVDIVNDDYFDYTEDEVRHYLERGKDMYASRKLERVKLNFDGENVEITYNFAAVPFERIRRITGYLVGTTDRWNDAKAAELRDRVKHSVKM